MILLLDNFDSFTYNLVDYFKQLNIEIKVFRNDIPLIEIIKYEYQGIVLSPGPETPQKAGNLLEVLNYFQDKLPILGICLGHQAIALQFGAKIIHATRPMHGKCSLIKHSRKGIFKDIKKDLRVVRYHSLVATNLNDDLIPSAWTEEGEIMALQHKYKPITGLQFHPESILSEQGLEILHNWLTINNIKQ
ncbi:MAG: aminodeoxychorismate/anthranilate synthase component II [Cytophagales bacterium]|nr:aminodeoxychorismate/anthranilate synthase component II [Cytophagales bacterium]